MKFCVPVAINSEKSAPEVNSLHLLRGINQPATTQVPCSLYIPLAAELYGEVWRGM